VVKSWKKKESPSSTTTRGVLVFSRQDQRQLYCTDALEGKGGPVSAVSREKVYTESEMRRERGKEKRGGKCKVHAWKRKKSPFITTKMREEKI